MIRRLAWSGKEEKNKMSKMAIILEVEFFTFVP